jgi:hypothetical protein
MGSPTPTQRLHGLYRLACPHAAATWTVPARLPSHRGYMVRVGALAPASRYMVCTGSPVLAQLLHGLKVLLFENCCTNWAQACPGGLAVALSI